MSLRPQPPLPPVPDDTARVARAAFRRGNPYVLLRDRLGAVFADTDFADLYPALGQPAYAPWRLALVTLWSGHKAAAWMARHLGLAGVHPQRGWDALRRIGWSIQAPRLRHPRGDGRTAG